MKFQDVNYNLKEGKKQREKEEEREEKMIKIEGMR